MALTIDYLQQRFREFNRRYFDGKLPPIAIRLSNTKTYAGQFRYRRGGAQGVHCEIAISLRYEQSATQYEDVLLHEMIHYAIFHSGVRDDAPHGRIFRSEMARINKQGGRHIAISNQVSPEDIQRASGRRSLHVVAVLDTKKGPMFKVLPKVAPTIRAYHKTILQNPEVREIRLYWTVDPFFDSYPASGAFYAHPIDEADLRERLAGATPIADEDWR